jgi:hypothetical protein
MNRNDDDDLPTCSDTAGMVACPHEPDRETPADNDERQRARTVYSTSHPYQRPTVPLGRATRAAPMSTKDRALTAETKDLIRQLVSGHRAPSLPRDC